MKAIIERFRRIEMCVSSTFPPNLSLINLLKTEIYYRTGITGNTDRHAHRHTDRHTDWIWYTSHIEFPENEINTLLVHILNICLHTSVMKWKGKWELLIEIFLISDWLINSEINILCQMMLYSLSIMLKTIDRDSHLPVIPLRIVYFHLCSTSLMNVCGANLA